MRNLKTTIFRGEKMKRMACSFYAVLFFATATVSADTDYYFNGGTHTINYTINQDNVYIQNAKVDMVDGGAFTGHTCVVNSGEFNVKGGTVNGLIAPSGNSTVNLTGGVLKGAILADSYSVVTIDGSQLNPSQNVYAQGNSTVILNRGTIGVANDYAGQDLRSDNSSTVIVNGGSVERLLSFGTSTMYINGGRFDTDGVAMAAIIHQDSSMHIKGGTGLNGIYLGLQPNWYESPDVFLYGSNFSVNGTAVTNGVFMRTGPSYSIYQVSGRLMNGDLLNTSIYLYDDSSLHIVPEPATIFLLAAAVPLAFRRRRHK